MHRKDYLIKRAFVEFITPMGETQIGINPRFNEQDEDEFRLQDVLFSFLFFIQKCLYSRGQPSQTKVSRKILMYTFLGLAFVNVGTLVGLLVSAIVSREYSSYQRNISYFIVIVSLLLTVYGSYAMQQQSLNHLTMFVLILKSSVDTHQLIQACL